MMGVRDVATMLKTARRDAGLSQVEAAERAGVGRATVQVAERTGETSTRTLCALASVYARHLAFIPASPVHASEACTPSTSRGLANAKGRPHSARNGGPAPTQGG
jgi:DNA-binding XRE family transcriptional regulator